MIMFKENQGKEVRLVTGRYSEGHPSNDGGQNYGETVEMEGRYRFKGEIWGLCMSQVLHISLYISQSSLEK